MCDCLLDDAQGEPVWVLIWTDFVSSELTWVDGGAPTLVTRSRRFDADAFYAALGSAAGLPEGPNVEIQDKVHPKSTEGVFRSLPSSSGL